MNARQLKEPSDYKDMAVEFAKRGWIDSLDNLESSKVYLFTGGADTVVKSPVVRGARDLYEVLGVPKEQIKLVHKDPPAGHSWVTNNFGNGCSVNAPPFIDKCEKYDQARDELEWIYGGPLEPPAPVRKGRLVPFDQGAFVEKGKANGLADTGYLFVPKECETGSAPPLCKLQVVLHGCLQSAESFPQDNDTFIEHIGVNEWADTNRIVVLYPQTHATTDTDLPHEEVMPFLNTNPGDCWNFWGYARDNMFPTKKGVQVSAIWQMIQKITGQANN
jgi:poly(3-hydroxybutyrate) depolymerase